MKTLAILSLLLAFVACTEAWAEETAPASQSPVVVELFQSQGCSDCPPAQEYLNRLSDREDVLALSFGVTYWDYLGWKDSFASPQFTQRQRLYSDRNHGIGVATPQFWINGRDTVLGANPARVAQLIALATPTHGPAVSITNSTLTIEAGSAPAGGADVWLVFFDPRPVSVAILAGENGGRTLSHRDVVRELKLIGHWSGGAQTVTLPSTPRDLKAAVFVQVQSGGPILSAVKL